MYFTVPETDEPTGTVVSGLIVPVASTVAVRGPRLTAAVRYFGLPEPLRRTRPAPRASTTAAPATDEDPAACEPGRSATGEGIMIRRIRGLPSIASKLAAGRWISLRFCPVALSALARNKLRTALTMLGITIGIAAVICTVAIGEGGSSRIREQLQNLGDNFVWVEAGSRNLQGVRTGTGTTKTLVGARRARRSWRRSR